jgi:competence protein ComEA
VSQPGPVDWRSLDESPRVPREARPRIDARLAIAGSIGVASLALLAGTFLVLAAPRSELVVDGPVASATEASPTTVASDVWIDVSGAVRRPGLYRLDPGSRVGDAIRTAGGFGPTVDAAAAERQLNLAAPLEDGIKVHVPARGEQTHPPTPSSDGGDRGQGLVDLNTATAGELEELPGIGEVTAAKIIAAREEQPFATVEELRSREIVGEATFEKVRDLVTAGN